MADLRTEEEQIELLKKWWNESGIATVAGVAFALFSWLGWTGWQNHNVSRGEEASSLYQTMSRVTDVSDAGASKQNELITSQLRDQFPESPYAVFAALAQAKHYADSQQYLDAQKALVWASEHAKTGVPELMPLVALRIAKLQFSQADYTSAIATLDSSKDSGEFSAEYLELKGDIFLAQGKISMATQAYSESIKALEKSGFHEKKQDVELKLSNLPASDISAAPVQGGNS